MKNEDFNIMVSSILVFYSKYLEIPAEEIMSKINSFNKQLDNQINQTNGELIQLGQDDQTTV